MSGNYLEWDSRGRKIKDIVYSEGNRIKEHLFVKDGMGFMEINKAYGKLDGPWIRWYSEGKKEEEGLYSRGTKIGTWSRFGTNGVVIE